MRLRICALTFTLAVVVHPGCQDGDSRTRGQPTASAASSSNSAAAFARDLERLCHSLERSGALERPEDERALAVAMWLGGNIESQAGRDFLARFNGASPNEKVTLLEREKARLGLADCPLIDAWSGPPAGP